MRRKPQAGLGIAALIVLTLVFPSRGAAQTTPSPWTAATATGTPTDTSGKTKQTIHVNSFSFGASDPVNVNKGTGPATGTSQGKTSISDITVGGTKPVTPVYTGPGINVPPSGGTPNDSLHHHPKH